MAMQTPDNKPGKYKETERFSIRRLTFRLSFAAFIYGLKVWDVTMIVISAAVALVSIVAKIISVMKETGDTRE
jgi:hypothetical protein